MPGGAGYKYLTEGVNERKYKMAKELITREEQKKEFTWNLGDIYPDKASYDSDVNKIKEITDKIAAKKGKSAESAKALLETMTLFEDFFERTYKLEEYAARKHDEDTGNNENLEALQKLETIVSECETKVSFMDPEIIAVPDDKFDKYYEEEEGLKKYKIYLTEVRRTKAHTLSTEMEELLALSSEACQTPSNTYGIFMNADLQYPEIEDENGEKVRITAGRFVPLEESRDRRVRKDAFEGAYNTLKQFKNTSASLYNGQVKKQIYIAKARNYSSTLECALDRNNVNPKVYHNLVDTINKHMDLMHRYVALRKKMLGVDELHMYDVYVPIVSDVEVKIPFEEAKETALKALAPLGDRYIELLKTAFNNRWLDVYENKGKRSGAYSAGCYGVHPYVLLNYNNTLDNQFTLVHEMGHAMHSFFSNEANPILDSMYKIFVAEVASTVNEVLLQEYLLKNETDKKKRMNLLNHYMESFKSTVYRQTMFAEFEMLTNEMAEKGESLSADALCKVYLDLNKKYFGDAMISDDLIAMEWARIPHFYYNFYVFQYATGYSSAVSIARRILKEGQSAVDDYMKFLHSGCTSDPVSLLKIAGVDLNTPAPLEAALKVFEEVLDEMESLI